MSSTRVVLLALLACTAELIVCLLNMRFAPVPTDKLAPALLGVVLGWCVFAWLLVCTYQVAHDSARRLFLWPSTAMALMWALAGGAALVQASQIQLAWLWGGHALIGIGLVGIVLVFGAAGEHAQADESALDLTRDAYDDLQTAVTRARRAIGRVELPTEHAERSRALLDRAGTLSRSASATGAGAEVVACVRRCADALPSEADAFRACLDELEDALRVAKATTAFGR